MKTNKQINLVRLSGVIASSLTLTQNTDGEDIYETLLRVPRLSGENDFIPLNISKKLLDNPDIKIGSTFSLTGELRNYYKFENGRFRLILLVYVKKLLPYIKNKNTVELTGYIYRPPIFRGTPLGRYISQINLVVNKDNIPCIAWNDTAFAARKLKIGDSLSISGRIQSREYEKVLDNGSTEIRTAYEVSINKII